MIRVVLRGIVALLAVTALVPADTSGETGFLDRSLTIGGQPYKYQVYVPIDWAASRKWPVVVDLHGNNGQGSDGFSHTRQSSLVAAIRADRTRFPSVIIWPQARQGTRWSTPAMQEMVLAQLDHTIKEFSGDPDRLYLTGFSMGGGGVIRIASKWPDRFAALVDLAGRVSVNAPGRDRSLVDEDVKAHPYLQSSDPFDAAARLTRAIPIWVVHGDADQVVPVEESRRLVAALKANGADVRYTELPSGDHLAAPGQGWTDKSLTEWLFAQRRSGWSFERRH